MSLPAMSTRCATSFSTIVPMVQAQSGSFALRAPPHDVAGCPSPARGPARTFTRYEEVPRALAAPAGAPLPQYVRSGLHERAARMPVAAALPALHTLSFQPPTPKSPAWDDDAEFSEPSSDLQGLLQYFDRLKKDGGQITELTYCVNIWFMANVIPVRHYGFVLKAGDEYLTLDFSQRGILWDTFDTYPDFPDRTIFVKKYSVNVDPLTLRAYCEETEPFSWFENDCFNWAQGLMQVVKIKEDPLKDTDCFLLDVPGLTVCGVQAFNPLRLISCCS